MEFKKEINIIHKEFFDIMKKHYQTSSIILKMICDKGLFNSLTEIDLRFRTCELRRFNDKNIDKLIDKDIEEAIHTLRSRGACCLYVISAIDEIILSYKDLDGANMKFKQQLKEINQKLYDLADSSINQSNELAKQNDLPQFEYQNNDDNIVL